MCELCVIKAVNCVHEKFKGCELLFVGVNCIIGGELLYRVRIVYNKSSRGCELSITRSGNCLLQGMKCV